MCVLVTRSDSFVIPWTVAHQVPHETLHARILEWVAISFSRGSSWLRDQTRASPPAFALAGGFFTAEAHGKTLHELTCNFFKPSSLLPVLSPLPHEKKVEGTFLHDFAFSHSSLIWPLPQLAAEVLIYHEKVFLREAWPRQQQEVQEISWDSLFLNTCLSSSADSQGKEKRLRHRGGGGSRGPVLNCLRFTHNWQNNRRAQLLDSSQACGHGAVCWDTFVSNGF